MAALVSNSKARFNYEILDTLEGGIELRGFETKSLKNRQGSLDGAFVIVRGGEAFLINAHIPPFQPGNTPASYDPYRNRRLLFSKKELRMLAEKEKEAGLTLIPISLYNKGRYVKVELGIARGKKKFDKRETIKKRDTERELRRTLKQK